MDLGDLSAFACCGRRTRRSIRPCACCIHSYMANAKGVTKNEYAAMIAISRVTRDV